MEAWIVQRPGQWWDHTQSNLDSPQYQHMIPPDRCVFHFWSLQSKKLVIHRKCSVPIQCHPYCLWPKRRQQWLTSWDLPVLDINGAWLSIWSASPIMLYPYVSNNLPALILSDSPGNNEHVNYIEQRRMAYLHSGFTIMRPYRTHILYFLLFVAKNADSTRQAFILLQ